MSTATTSMSGRIKWKFIGAIVVGLLALKSAEEAQRLLKFGNKLSPAPVEDVHSSTSSTKPQWSLTTFLLTPPVQVPPSSTPPNRLTVIFCKSCHANGLYQHIYRFVQEHVRWSPPSRERLEETKTVLQQDTSFSNPQSDDQEDEHTLVPLDVYPVSGSPAPLFKALGVLVGAAQLLIVTACVCGIDRMLEVITYILPAGVKQRILGLPNGRLALPQLSASWTQYRWQILGATFFMGNILRNMLLTTKAFELFLGDTLIFSALATGRTPTIDDIVHGLELAGAVITRP